MRRIFAGEADRRYHSGMPPRDLTCRELTDFIYAYEEGELPEAERAAFEAHLAECPDCVAYLAGYRRSVALGKQAFADSDEPVPDDVPEDLVRAVLAARRRQRLM
jgi:anti-sigma factor RsiW